MNLKLYNSLTMNIRIFIETYTKKVDTDLVGLQTALDDTINTDDNANIEVVTNANEVSDEKMKEMTKQPFVVLLSINMYVAPELLKKYGFVIIKLINDGANYESKHGTPDIILHTNFNDTSKLGAILDKWFLDDMINQPHGEETIYFDEKNYAILCAKS